MTEGSREKIDLRLIEKITHGNSVKFDNISIKFDGQNTVILINGEITIEWN